MKNFNLFFELLFVFVILAGCEDNNETMKSISVDLNVNEQYEYDTKIAGDEEGVSISIQANHFLVSEVIRDSSTNYSCVYKYQPAPGYTGTDKVELKLSTGSDGASPPTNIEFIKINFKISERDTAMKRKLSRQNKRAPEKRELF